MNKQAALARITTMEQEIAALRKIVDAPVSLLDPEATTIPMYTDVDKTRAEDYGYALRTLVRLRTMPGTVPPNEVNRVFGNLQHFIEPHYNSEGVWVVTIKKYSGISTKLSRISPAFDTYENAERAINALGSKPLLHMFCTLAHFTPDHE